MATFSPLTYKTYSMIESNYSSRNGAKVSRLIIHHTTGGTLAYLLDLFRQSKKHNRSASVTYILDREGRLHGLVPEEYRPWTSGGAAADNPSITVETMTFASDGYAVTPAQLETLARLAADLSNRYGWGPLNRQNVRGHREFASTSCPGPYLWPRLDSIVARANEIRAGKSTTPAPKPPVTPTTPGPAGTVYEVTAAALNVRSGPGTNHATVGTALPKGTRWTATGKTSGAWIEGRTPWMVQNKATPRWVHSAHLKVVSKPAPPAPKPAPPAPPTYTTTATALNVRTGPGTNYKTYGSALPKGTKWYGTGKTSGSWVEGRTPWMRTNKVAAQWVHGDHISKV